MVATWKLGLHFFATALFANTVLAAHPYPLGVSFGQGNITAALIGEDGSPVLLVNSAGTTAYRQLMLDSIDYEGLQWESDGDWYFSNDSDPIQIPKPGNNLAMEAIFLENLLKIRQIATQKLGYSPNITSMVYPRHLNDTAREIFQKVVIENEPGISVARQLGDSYEGAFRAYDFHRGPVGGPVVFVDYDDEYVDQAVGQIVKDRSIAESNGYDLRFRGMGRVDGASRITDNDTERSKAQRSGRINWGFDRGIRKSARMIAVDPDYADKIRDSIDPAFVGAVGAAKWAKFQVDHAESFFNEPVERDEL